MSSVSETDLQIFINQIIYKHYIKKECRMRGKERQWEGQTNLLFFHYQVSKNGLLLSLITLFFHKNRDLKRRHWAELG